MSGRRFISNGAPMDAPFGTQLKDDTPRFRWSHALLVTAAFWGGLWLLALVTP